MSVLITFLVFNLVIFVHEMGHFIFAKYGGIGVIEFSLGMGPRLWGFKKGDTDYSLRLLPIGGYVRLAGLDDSGVDFDKGCYFQNRPIYHRFSTILAGSFMNIVLGYILFFMISFFVGEMVISKSIQSLVPDMPASRIGLQSQDVLLSLDGELIQDVRHDFISVISQSDSLFSITVLREGVEKQFSCKPVFDEKTGLYKLGIVFGTDNEPVGFFRSFLLASDKTMGSVKLFFVSFKELFKGNASFKELSGPIGIFQFASYQLEESFFQFLGIFALISILLGMMNLLPIPVLDGGHLMFLLYELIFKKPVSQKVIVFLSNVFALLLILLMVVVTFNDIAFWSDRVDFLKGL
ncbi:RIP metalloprotease RseP [Candidatus Marinamargulisbacteria bacterium SCGC AG-343-D04]|nr:RIP metalloprotease RseP [Candidatus Marinamargulisbacteria bacterium SCGC AG-343-D04]